MQEELVFNKIELFTVLVWAFHKEQIEIADFDPLYVENCFKVLQAVKNKTGSLVRNLQNKVNFAKQVFDPPIDLNLLKCFYYQHLQDFYKNKETQYEVVITLILIQ